VLQKLRTEAAIGVAESEYVMSKSDIRSFRDSDAWQRAMDLCVFSYKAIPQLPDNERFGLRSQMRRAGVSVPSNIAEGQSCGEEGRYIPHLRTSIGSVGELDTQFEVAKRLHVLPQETLVRARQHLDRTGQVLRGLLRARRRKRLARLAPRLALLAGFGFALFRLPFLA
jgi:four helix bundle protein